MKIDRDLYYTEAEIRGARRRELQARARGFVNLEEQKRIQRTKSYQGLVRRAGARLPIKSVADLTDEQRLVITQMWLRRHNPPPSNMVYHRPVGKVKRKKWLGQWLKMLGYMDKKKADDDHGYE